MPPPPRPKDAPPKPAVADPARIRKSMARWRKMDHTACLLGRGLGRDELIDRVAKEVGASLRQVRSALRGLVVTSTSAI